MLKPAAKSERDVAKNERGRRFEGNSDLAMNCNRRETGARSKKETHLDIAWGSLNMCQGSTGRQTSKTAWTIPENKWANLKRQPSVKTGNARDEGDRAKPHCLST